MAERSEGEVAEEGTVGRYTSAYYGCCRLDLRPDIGGYYGI